jgi:hypothetical protein
MRLRLTGAEVQRLLEHQLSLPPGRRLHTSGLRYGHGAHRELRAVVAGQGRLVADRTYTVAASELIATGGRLPGLSDRPRGRTRVGTELEALEALFRRQAR